MFSQQGDANDPINEGNYNISLLLMMFFTDANDPINEGNYNIINVLSKYKKDANDPINEGNYNCRLHSSIS